MSIATDRCILDFVATNTLKHMCSGERINQKKVEVYRSIIESGEQGLTTRKVADVCDMSIYAARNWLIKLQEDNLIRKNSEERNATWTRN